LRGGGDFNEAAIAMHPSCSSSGCRAGYRDSKAAGLEEPTASRYRLRTRRHSDLLLVGCRAIKIAQRDSQ
jgi:hypothetical protein